MCNEEAGSEFCNLRIVFFFCMCGWESGYRNVIKQRRRGIASTGGASPPPPPPLASRAGNSKQSRLSRVRVHRAANTCTPHVRSFQSMFVVSTTAPSNHLRVVFVCFYFSIKWVSLSVYFICETIQPSSLCTPFQRLTLPRITFVCFLLDFGFHH